MRVGGQTHAPTALPPGRTRTHYVGGLVGPRAGLQSAEKLVRTGIRSREPPALSKSLYRLRYPGPRLFCQNI
jgi:hypothetical protein